jgi:polypeptide N-acetylgalactosaminyltransferase
LNLNSGENYELSLKLWLCSGKIIAVPCSAVLHLSKLGAAHRTMGDGSDFSGRNLKRVAEVWLDDYKKFFYLSNPERYARIDAGDLTKQFELKKRLNCKPFQYYLDEVATEMLEKYPIEPKYIYGGSLMMKSNETLCLGATGFNYEQTAKLYQCSKDLQKPNKNSDLFYTFHNTIRINNFNDQCLDFAQLNFLGCHNTGGNQGWRYNPQTGLIKVSYLDRCLTGRGLGQEVYALACDEKNEDQKWIWSLKNETAIENLD